MLLKAALALNVIRGAPSKDIRQPGGGSRPEEDFKDGRIPGRGTQGSEVRKRQSALHQPAAPGCGRCSREALLSSQLACRLPPLQPVEALRQGVESPLAHGCSSSSQESQGLLQLGPEPPVPLRSGCFSFPAPDQLPAPIATGPLLPPPEGLLAILARPGGRLWKPFERLRRALGAESAGRTWRDMEGGATYPLAAPGASAGASEQQRIERAG